MSQFVVRPFAFMRLTHEALRAGFEGISEAAADGDVPEVRSRLNALRAVVALHARQEEEVFFPLLDRLFDGAVHKAGLRDAHHREDGFQEQLDIALAADDREAVRRAIEAWAPSFEQHLADEEAVMMPLTGKVADTPEGRAAAVREIVELDWDALRTDHLPYVVSSLAEHKPYGPLRMFVSALQVATGERYAELEDIVVAALPGDKAQMLRHDGHLT